MAAKGSMRAGAAALAVLCACGAATAVDAVEVLPAKDSGVAASSSSARATTTATAAATVTTTASASVGETLGPATSGSTATTRSSTGSAGSGPGTDAGAPDAATDGSEPGDAPDAVAPSGFPGLYATGVDSQGVPLPGGAVDPHYTLTSSDPTFPGPDAYTALSSAVGAHWAVTNQPSSTWISVQPNVEGDLYTYVFATTFELGAANVATASLTGQVACDDTCVIQLNGIDVGMSLSPYGWMTFAGFSIPAGGPFTAGSNTLAVVVNNSGGYSTGAQLTDLQASVGH